MKRLISVVFLLVGLAAVGQYQLHSQPYIGFATFSYGPNKLRNSTMTSWFHGSNYTTGANWCGEGIYVVASGAGGMNVNRITNALSSPYNLSVHACELTGNTGITDITARFVIESYDAATFAGQAVTCQFPVLNLTGATLNPTLAVYSGGSQDSWSSFNTDVSPTALQSVANNATGVLAYTFTGSATANNGLSIDIDFGNNFSTNLKKVDIGGGFNCRVTPGAPTGLVDATFLAPPDILPAAADTNWNKRFYTATYSNNGSSVNPPTHTDILQGKYFSLVNSSYNGPTFIFPTTMRAPPAVTLYDGASGSAVVSSLNGVTWTDNVAITGIGNLVVGTNSFMVQGTGGGTGTDVLYLHYTADATLIGH